MSDSEPNNGPQVKRGRGRPRKDPSAAPVPKKSDAVSNGSKVSGKRGRKEGSTNKPKTVNNEQGVKRGRGRPKKSESEKKVKTKKIKKAESSESEEAQDNSSPEESDE